MSGQSDDVSAVTQVRRTLAVALRMFAERDFDEGAAGHLTARDPSDPDHVFMNPQGVPFDEMTASTLSRVHLPTGEVDGEPVDAGGLRLHRAIYNARHDIGSVMHAHPVHLKAWSTLNRPIAPISQEACIFYGCHAVLDEYLGVFGATDEGDRVARLLGPHNIAVILRHHSAVTVGATVEAAAYRFYILDRCCHVQLLAEAAAGGPVEPIAHDVAAELARHTGFSHDSFGPIYRSLVRRHPDVLD